ncbi:monovalent cation:proton antiporter family protein [Limosilactobacillus sp. WF-MT5-A]|uniref:monovalent cation:proton antiporter family protein n=1 Tax=Limosilactobacillus agrestis TaxID=2759748 RepID=UPI0015FDC298|nr:cation:proton antiporter [Limosilactobacillus agrestis]MBB1099342.1 monovalent cation:proton antiporter family protein [Limosilactobacillus agrestis]MCD7126528.1 cation:proton antiporter [Limosilactobacillus agrestis]
MQQLSLLIVMLAALIIPIIMVRFKVSSVPTAVAEILTGIVIGKSFLNIVNPNPILNMMSSLGVIMLMFLSGMEINFDLFRKTPGKKRDSKSPVVMASQAFGLVVVTALVIAIVISRLHLFNDVLLATIIFSTIALGVVIATLKEKDILQKPVGQTILLTAVLGEVIPMLALTFYASINGGNAKKLWLIVLLFLAAFFLLWRFKQTFAWFNKISKSTTQLDIRLAFFLIFALVTIAETVGAENILGAFLAGMVMKLLEPSDATEDRLNSIGYGFLIPFFFIMTGDRLDLKNLFVNRQALALIPILVIGFILAKLPTMLVYRRRFKPRNSLAGSFLVATTITLVLPTLQVAQNLHAITRAQSDAFTLAAVIVCIIAPILFNSMYKLEKSDLIKQRVNFVGANTLTVPISQQLYKNWYDVRMVTDNENNFKTYNSEVKHLEYMPKLDAESLEKGGYFDCDIMVVGFLNDRKSARLAQIAKEHGVKRVIASQNNPSLDPKDVAALRKKGVEIFNNFNVQSSALRGLIESPSILRMLTDTEAGLFEATVLNSRYIGRELHTLPFINHITVSRIFRNHKPIDPHGDTVIEYGDHLLFTGDRQAAQEVREELRRSN